MRMGEISRSPAPLSLWIGQPAVADPAQEGASPPRGLPGHREQGEPGPTWRAPPSLGLAPGGRSWEGSAHKEPQQRGPSQKPRSCRQGHVHIGTQEALPPGTARSGGAVSGSATGRWRLRWPCLALAQRLMPPARQGSISRSGRLGHVPPLMSLCPLAKTHLG